MAIRLSLPRRVMLWVKRAAILIVIWWVIHVTVMMWVGYRDDLRSADAAVVLGNGVNPDGTPGPVLRYRLDRALEVYRAGLVRHVIVSGATWRMDYNEPAAMRRYLVAGGVPDSVIIEDTYGVNTYNTAINTLATMHERDIQSIMIVTDAYHILRTRLAMSLTGVKDVRSAHARAPLSMSLPFWMIRETVGFYRYLLHDYKAAGVPGRSDTFGTPAKAD